MAIEAELADGRILEFPDGTNPAVIQATVKRLLGLPPAPPAPAPAAVAPAVAPKPAPTPTPAPAAVAPPAPAPPPAPVAAPDKSPALAASAEIAARARAAEAAKAQAQAQAQAQAAAASIPPAVPASGWPVGMNPKWIPDKEGSRTGPGRLKIYGKDAGRFNSSTEAFAEVAKQTLRIEQQASAPAVPTPAVTPEKAAPAAAPPTGRALGTDQSAEAYLKGKIARGETLTPAETLRARTARLIPEFSSSVFDPTIRNDPAAIVDYKRDLPSTNQMVTPEFVQKFEQSFAGLPLEQRLAKLRTFLTPETPYILRMAAQQILERVNKENQRTTGRDETSELAKLIAQSTPVKAKAKLGGGEPKQTSKPPVAFPEATPNFADTQTPAEVARQNELMQIISGQGDAITTAEISKNFDPNDPKYEDALARRRKQKFAETDPIKSATAAGAANLLSGTINTPSVLADAFNQTFINPVLKVAGLNPLVKTPTAFGTDYLNKTADDFMPSVGKQELGEAIDKKEFGAWLTSKLAANSPQIVLQLAAAFAPPLRMVLLGGMGATSAGQSYVQGDDSRVSVAKGLLEILTEMLPLKVFDKLRGLSYAKQNTILAVAGQRVLQTGGELTAISLTNAIEETVSKFGGNVLDKYFQGKNISLDKGLAESALLGAVTGVGMSAPRVINTLAGKNDLKSEDINPPKDRVDPTGTGTDTPYQAFTRRVEPRGEVDISTAPGRAEPAMGADELLKTAYPEPTGGVDISASPGPAEPTMDKPAAIVAAEDRQTKIDAKTKELRDNGIPKDNATPIATRLVDRELAEEAKLSAIGIPENRVEELTQGLIASGVNPQEAEVMARGIAEQEAKNDADAEAETKTETATAGEPNVTRPITEPSGASVDVSGQPSTDVPPAEGTTETELGGVASTGSDVADTTVGEGKKPDAVAEVEPTAEEKYQAQEARYQAEIKAEDEANAILDAKVAKAESVGRANAQDVFDMVDSEYGGDIDAAIDSYRNNTQDTLAGTRTERGERPEEQAMLGNRADQAFDAEIKKLKAAAAAAAPTETKAPAKPAKPVKRTHSVAPATEGTGYVHSVNDEPVATYPTKALANIAARLGRSQDTGNPEAIKTNTDALAAAQAKQAGPSAAGRPKGPEKTPEQVTTTKETDKANRQADNIAINAIPLLADPSTSVRETATYDLLKAQKTAAKNGAVYNRIKQALEDVPPEVMTRVENRIATEVKNRAAAEVLDNIPPDTATGKPLASAVSSLTASASKPNPKFEEAINASEAIGVVLADKNATAFQKFVARRLLNYVRGVEFVVIEKGEVLPPELEFPENKALWDNARGAFFGWQNQDRPGQRVIFIKGGSFGNASGINNVTVLHEILHAATNRRIITGGLAIIKPSDPLKLFLKELNDLQDTARRQYEKLVAAGDAPPRLQAIVKAEPNIFNSPDEFLAYGMSDPTFQEFLMGVQGKRQDASGFSKFVRSIRELYNFDASETNAFTDLIDLTDKILGAEPRSVNAGTTKARLLSQKLPPDEYKDQFDEEADKKPKRTPSEIKKAVDIALNKVATSETAEDLAKGIKSAVDNRNADEARGMLGKITEDLNYGALEATVRLPTFDFLAKWAKDKGIPELVNTQVLLQRMIGESQQFLAGAEQIIGGLKRGYKADPTLERKKFEAFVLETTLAEIDPSDTNARERSVVLDAKYAALGPTGQRMYKQVRDYYESVAELYSDLLDAQIQNIQGMSPDDKSKLMLVIRKTFESDARIRPYFPLVRRGDFWLAIGSGDTREFYLFKSRAERNDVAKKLAAERGRTLAELVGDKNFEVGNDLATLRAATKDSSEMLKQVFSAIDGMSATETTDDVKEGLKDAVYQIYLNTMPEQSFRKQFTHRKGRTGFSTDLQQNIATTAAKQAIQLSRLKYAPLLRNSMSAAKDSIAEQEELSPFVQEAKRRVDMALSGERGGTGEAIAGAANKLSYVWYLSAASSALIQPTSVFLTGLPILAANHGDPIGAAKELAKMVLLINQYSVFRTNSDGSTSLSAPSIANSQSLSEDEREAVREMTARGVSQSTYASLVWGYKDMSTEQREGVMGKGKELANLLVGGLMHNTERLSREAVYLASYRMGRNRGLTHEQAISQAVSDTNEALGNYDMANRPRFMQEGLGKVSLQFQMYPLHMLLLQATNFKRLLLPLNEEGRTVAVTKFFGIMGTSIMLGGVSNAFLFSPIIGLLGWIWSKLEEEEGWPKTLKDLDFITWFRTVFMPEKLGHISLGGVSLSNLVESLGGVSLSNLVDRGPINAITGLDVASRIGLNDLPIVGGRDTKEAGSAKEATSAFILDKIGGPTASMALSWGEAYDAYVLGDYQKMSEKASPAIVRNLLTAYRFSTEGAKTNTGVQILTAQNFRTGELIGQAIGFRPDIIANAQKTAFKLIAVERRIEKERDALLDKLDLQRRQSTISGFDNFSKLSREDVRKFNLKYPTFAIAKDTIMESLDARAKQRAESVVGVQLDAKTKTLLNPYSILIDISKRELEMNKKREGEAKK